MVDNVPFKRKKQSCDWDAILDKPAESSARGFTPDSQSANSVTNKYLEYAKHMEQQPTFISLKGLPPELREIAKYINSRVDFMLSLAVGEIEETDRAEELFDKAKKRGKEAGPKVVAARDMALSCRARREDVEKWLISYLKTLQQRGLITEANCERVYVKYCEKRDEILSSPLALLRDKQTLSTKEYK